MTPFRRIEVADAPAAIGPYSQAVEAGGWVFTSGQIALDVRTGRLVEGGIAEQTERVLENLAKVLCGAGCGLADVVRTTVYLLDMDEFAAMNAVYARSFGGGAPARATVEVSRLPAGARVEIDAVARRP